MGKGLIQEVKHVVDHSRAYRHHVHDELSLAYVWHGATHAWIDGLDVPIAGECVVVIPPQVPHACNPVPASGWTYTLALLQPEVCTHLPVDLLASPCHVLPATVRLREAFEQLRCARDVPATDLLAGIEVAAGLAGSMHVPSTRRASSHTLRRAVAYLRAHWDEPVSLSALGSLAGLSKYHLVRAFRESYGLTPHAYLLNLRVNRAKAFLRAGEELAAVAQQSGFCDQSHLHRVFVRHVGVTPRAYQHATAIPSKT